MESKAAQPNTSPTITGLPARGWRSPVIPSSFCDPRTGRKDTALQCRERDGRRPCPCHAWRFPGGPGLEPLPGAVLWTLAMRSPPRGFSRKHGGFPGLGQDCLSRVQDICVISIANTGRLVCCVCFAPLEESPMRRKV